MAPVMDVRTWHPVLEAGAGVRVAVALVYAMSSPLAAQTQTKPTGDFPLTPLERVQWVIDGSIGFRSLVIVGPVEAGFQTVSNTPPEWEQSWHGFGRRYLQ